MTPDRLTEIATRYTEAWCSRDATTATSHFAPNGSFSINGGEPATGRSAIAGVYQGYFEAFPDAVLSMDHVRGASNKAIFSWTYEGTNTGPDGTGKAVRFSGWEAWTFSAEGLVQTSIGTFDADEYERQLAEGI